MDFLESLTAKGFTIVGALVLVSIAAGFIPGASGIAPLLVTLIVGVTWLMFIVGGWINDRFEFTEKELTTMGIIGVILGIVGVGAFGFDVIPQFTAQVSQLGVLFSAGLLPLALGAAAGLITNTILGAAKWFMG